MKNAHLIVVGKLKDKNFEQLEDHYFKQVKSPGLKIHEVKARAENKDLEAEIVLKKIKDISKNEKAYIIALAEHGKEYDSIQFSKWLYDKVENHNHIIFVIAGAQGHGKVFLDQINDSISLSRMTFPHKMARLVFIEQFYRAITIKNGHPYHN